MVDDPSRGSRREPLVLVLSNSDDVHVPPVLAALGCEAVRYVRVDTDRAWPDSSVELDVAGPTTSGRLHVDGRVIDLSDVTAIWNRRPQTPATPTWLSGDARTFAAEETAAALHGVLRCLDARWLNHPDRVRAASFKPAQLNAATSCGFSVPRTYVGQDPMRVRRFVEAVGGTAIVKLVSPGPPRVASNDPYNVFAHLVSIDDLGGDEAISSAPAIWQEPVAKSHELRVTLVGDQVLCCAIDSQADAASRTDWRRGDPDTIDHAAVDLDDTTAQRCRALAARYGLEFAAFDLIVTPTGEVVFLEFNPNGQWLWIEELSGLPIAATIASWLTAP